MTTINQILTEIATPNTIWQEIMDNIMQHDSHMKNELISELAISFIKNSDKIEAAYESGYFKYIFISAVRNQYHSQTSPFYLNNKQTLIGKISHPDIDITYVNTEAGDMEDAIKYNKQMDALDVATKGVSTSWFDSQIIDLHFNQDMSYREIGKIYDICHNSVGAVINKYKRNIRDYINKNNLMD